MRKEPDIKLHRIRRPEAITQSFGFESNAVAETIDLWETDGITIVYSINGKPRQTEFKSLHFPNWWRVDGKHDIRLTDFSCDCPGGCMKISKAKRNGKEIRDCYHILVAKLANLTGVFNPLKKTSDINKRWIE